MEESLKMGRTIKNVMKKIFGKGENMKREEYGTNLPIKMRTGTHLGGRQRKM